MTPTVSVIVPVYFNEHSLPLLFDALLEVEGGLRERGLALELIFVDDGSRDGSLAVLRQLKARRPATKVVKLTRNFGAVHASKTGMRFVTGDCFVVLAADLQDPPELILEMADHWRQGAKFVVCVREGRADSPLSVLFSKLYYGLLRLFVVRDYPPGGYDPALMSKEFLPYMLESGKNVNTPLFAWWLGFEPVKIPFSRRKRLHGTSRWTFLKRVKFFADSILGFSIVPLRVMSFFGGLVAFASFGYGSVIAVNALRGVASVPGFPTLAVILSFLLGIVILMLGIIGEYIWRIFVEVTRRPEAVIDEVL
ncbi:MAG TPA: glycosyl transferase [Acidobacteria bacterium]|nr:glycosyl transferase [Acidobacteriota bacterium]